MYAIIKTGGKQYKVEAGQILKVEKLPVVVGDRLEFDKVLVVSEDNGQVEFGRPYLEGVKVRGRVFEHGKNKKVIVFKYRAKKRYRRKTGHRQPYTRVLIEEIVVNQKETEDKKTEVG